MGALIPIASDSLPLMGIENVTRWYRRCADPSAHYPSWGSKTRVQLPVTQSVPVLITPHGDRKPPISATDLPFRGTCGDAEQLYDTAGDTLNSHLCA